MSAHRINEIFIAYEVRHIEEARSRVEGGAAVVCLDFWIEQELTKRHIHLVSLRDVLDSETGIGEWWALSNTIAREWYRLPAMQFFKHKDIPLGEVVEPIFGEYLAKLFYYVRICEALRRAYPDAFFSFPVPVANDSHPTCLAPLLPWVLLDAARMVGLNVRNEEGKTVSVGYVFPRSTWKSRVLRAYNALMNLLPRRRFKIYASGYWTYVVPIVPYLHDTELVLWESVRYHQIPWRHRLRHRIRILQSQGIVSRREEYAARRSSEKFMDEWGSAKKEVAAYLTSVRRDIDWTPVLEACTYLMTYAPRAIADINTLRRGMEKEKPNVVLPMASTGGPHDYFFLMARIAKQLGILSIELQHAGVHLDPNSVYTRIETDYLATYGENVEACRIRAGNHAGNLIPVGSPRFDEYVNERAKGIEKGKQLFKEFGLDPRRPVLFAAILYSDALVSSVDINSYQLAEYFKTIRAAQERCPGLQVLFKFRDYKYANPMREYLKELFLHDMAIAGNEDVFALLSASDAAVCGNSTVIYQAILAQKPLILHPWKSFDRYRADMYAPAAPLCYAASDAIENVSRIFADSSYREELLARQKQFLKSYSFDGKSSERIAALLRNLPKLGQQKP